MDRPPGPEPDDDRPSPASPSPPSAAKAFAGLLALAVAVTVGFSLFSGTGQTKSGPGAAAPTPSTVSTSAPVPGVTAPDGSTTDWTGAEEAGSDKPIGPESLKQCPSSLGRLVIEGPGGGDVWLAQRWNCDARTGARAIVVRRTDGSFGRLGAVVTAPVDREVTGETVAVGGAVGHWAEGVLTWTLGGKPARVRGDLELSRADLIRLAETTSLDRGTLRVDAPAGFTVVSSGLLGSPLVNEQRYGAKDLGVAGTLGDGLVYSGLTTGAGFEDQLYAIGRSQSGTVRGRPAVLSTVPGGNANLAWEPRPGLVAYVGYSGAAWTDTNADKIAKVLHDLADRTRLVSK